MTDITLTDAERVDAAAQILTEHGYSDSHIGRCHCGVKTDDMPTHQAALIVAADPYRSEAQVKAEALREAARQVQAEPSGLTPGARSPR